MKNRFTVSNVFALSLLSAVACAQINGFILNDGDDSFGYGVTVSNGVSTGVVPLPTTSTPGTTTTMNFNVGDGLNNISRVQHLNLGN